MGVSRRQSSSLSSVRPVDVTTLRTTPSSGMAVDPLTTADSVNGSALRISFSWRRWLVRTTRNRRLSASRPVGPGSIPRRVLPPDAGDHPPPRAQENVRGKARPLSQASAEMGRSTDADGERERARASPSDSLHRRLDKRRFIDATALEHCRPTPLPRLNHCSRAVAHPQTQV